MPVVIPVEAAPDVMEVISQVLSVLEVRVDGRKVSVTHKDSGSMISIGPDSIDVSARNLTLSSAGLHLVVREGLPAVVDFAQLQARGVELRLDLGHGVPKLERHREGMVLTGEGPHGLHVQSQGAIDVQAHDGVSLKSAGTVKVSARELDLDADEALRAHGRALSVLSDEATSIAANHLTLSGGAELTANAPVIDLAASVGLHAHGPAVELLAESNGVVRIGGERLLANVEKVGIYATNSLEITSSADISIEAVSAVKLSGQKVRADAGGIELEAGVVSTHGRIKAETVECISVIATSYTPGAGNTW